MPNRNLPPQGHRLRHGRVSVPGQIYLVTAVTHGRQPWFADFGTGRLVVHGLRYPHDRNQLSSLAYVVMPDHVHWLLALGENITLDQVMCRFKGYTSLNINRALARTGRVWQPGFHDHALRQEQDIQGVARYIVANPLRAGLVRRIGDYPLWDAVWL